MSGTISVPNPIVGIERLAAVFVHLTVESREILPVFTQADRTLESAIISRIEHSLLVVRSAFDKDIAQRLVPFLATCLNDFCEVESCALLTFEVLLCLLLTDERNAITETDLLCACGKAESRTSTRLLGNPLVANLAVLKESNFLRFYIELAKEVNLHVSAQPLTACSRFAIDLHTSVFREKQNRCGLRRVLQSEFVDGTLMADGQMNTNRVVGNLNLIIVRRNVLVVPSCGNDALKLLVLRDAQAKSASFAMIGDGHWQTVEHLGSIVATSRIDAHQAVRQLNRGETGHQQMTDTSDVGVHIIHWSRLCRNSERSHQQGC